MTSPALAAMPSDKAELANMILSLISDPRSTARQISRVLEGLPSLRQSVMFSAVDHLKGRGVVRNSTQAVVLIGFNRLKQLVCDFIEALFHASQALTSGPHRLTQPQTNRPSVDTGSEKN